MKISEMILKGYLNGWYTNCKARYRLFKGARNTGKSHNLIGIEALIKLLSDRKNKQLNACLFLHFNIFNTLFKSCIASI